jgi:hypothetical protein
LPEDLLTKIKTQATLLRATQHTIENLEERLSAAKQERLALARDILPDLLAQAGTPSLTIEAEGNQPAYKITSKPFARANIAANWDPARRQEALDWLDTNGHGDLIKTEILVALNKDQRAAALDLIEKLEALGYTPDVLENVNHMTLSKWLRECIARGVMVPLDIIGGEVGMEATIKELDE